MTTSKTTTPQRVAILGGGITGVTLAAALAERGIEVHLFESQPKVGGLASTFEWDGFRFDHGPHEFCTESPALTERLRDVLGDDFLLRDRRACQFFMGSEIPYPFSLSSLVGSVGAGMLARVAVEVLAGRLRSFFWQQENYSFRNWTESRYGRTLYAKYFGPYTKKVWGVAPETLDPRTASRRIAFNSIFDYLYSTPSCASSGRTWKIPTLR